ncbi:MAG: type III secretion system export apparatus subunit SctR [Pseudomonadota bacterium]
MDLGNYSPGLILGLVLSVAMAPYVAVMITAFTKLVVVFSLLRNALGLQQTPPNVVLNGLAIILSFYMMYPIGIEISDIVDKEFATRDLEQEEITPGELLQVANQAKEPLRQFLVDHTSDKERAFFTATAKKLLPEEKRSGVSDTDLTVIIPAFTVSELSRAFQIGFLIFLPFLIIDLIVSNILQALGMMMLSPTTISLPFKILLFVLLDGWSKLIHGLVLTY